MKLTFIFYNLRYNIINYDYIVGCSFITRPGETHPF